MNRLTAAACLTCLMFALPAMAQSNNPSETNASSLTNSGAMAAPPNHYVDKTDRKFLDHAAKDDQGEIRLSLLSEKDARNPAVKAFARLAVNDANVLTSEIAWAADQLQQPAGGGISQQADKALQKLRTLKGGHFDVQYMQDQIALYQKAIRRFGREERSTGDQSMRAVTQTALPILRQDLHLAQDVNNAIQSAGQQPPHGKNASQNSGAATANSQTHGNGKSHHSG